MLLGPFQGLFPCLNQDDRFAAAFRAASLMSLPDASYVFPQILVWFVFGELDTGSPRGHGLLFHRRLLDSGSPLLGISISPGTRHATPSTNAVANRIRLVLEEGCVPHPPG